MIKITTARHVSIPVITIEGQNGFLDYTEVVIDDDGLPSLSRYEGHLPLGQGGEGFFRAAYEKRKRPGFYRIDG